MHLPGFGAGRNFDGADSNFGDVFCCKSTSSNAQKVSAYASKESTNANRVVFVAINRSSASAPNFGNPNATTTSSTFCQNHPHPVPGW
jgi:hypothetical protein